jgi:hypothetical protein
MARVTEKLLKWQLELTIWGKQWWLAREAKLEEEGSIFGLWPLATTSTEWSGSALVGGSASSCTCV